MLKIITSSYSIEFELDSYFLGLAFKVYYSFQIWRITSFAEEENKIIIKKRIAYNTYNIP